MLIMATLLAGIPAGYAQTSPADFTGEPDKTMAAAHESFVKKDMNKAAEQISKAADYVKKEAGKVAKDTSEGVKMYQLNEVGLIVGVSITGAKYYKDKELN
jgi:hypothetical protein